MPPDDILLNKATIIERCVRRMLEESSACPRLDMSVLRWIVESGHRDWIRLGEVLGVSIRP